MGFFNSLVNNVVDAGKKLINKGEGQSNPGGTDLGMGNQASTFSDIQAASNMNAAANVVQNNSNVAGPSMPPQPDAQMQNGSGIPVMPPMQDTAGTTSGGYSQPEKSINPYEMNQGTVGTTGPAVNPFANGPTNQMPPMPNGTNGMSNSYDQFAMQNQSMNQMPNMGIQNMEGMQSTNMVNQNPMVGMNMTTGQGFDAMQNPQMVMPDMQTANMPTDQAQNPSQNSFMPKDETAIQQGPKPAFFVPQEASLQMPAEPPQAPAEPIGQQSNMGVQPSVGQMNAMPGMEAPIPQQNPAFIDNQSQPQMTGTNNFINDGFPQSNFNDVGSTDNSTNNWGA